MADHNDPNAVNSIFSDIAEDAADVYDMFGYPSDVVDPGGGERVVVALTFAPVPDTGVFDEDLLYRIHLGAHPRVVSPLRKRHRTVGSALRYVEAVTEKYLGNFRPAEVRVTVDGAGNASVALDGFRGTSFNAVVPTNEVVPLSLPGGHRVTVFVGGRDDAFFNDLPGFFRSINYAPQFYHVPHTMPMEMREMPIPKTLIELEGNDLFNFDQSQPLLGRGEKRPLPPGPHTWEGDSFAKDADGNYRFVYSGEDAQAGRNINCIVLELPLAMLTKDPDEDRVVTTWAESWVRKAVGKVKPIGEGPLVLAHPFTALAASIRGDRQLKHYKRVDTVGQPFADAALCERFDRRQVGAHNLHLGPHFINRLGHLGWGFGPSVTALGLECSFDHDNAPVSVHRTYSNPAAAWPRVRKVLLQELKMPDESWRRNPGVDVPLRRPIDIFVPNVCAIDMDTNGTWPFGRRLEDQVATRFLSMFLDMSARGYHIELLGSQKLWDGVRITPKTPPNPLRNDKEFLPEFPYLAEPW